MPSEDNNQKAGVFEYIIAFCGITIFVIGFLLLFGGNTSFLSENFDGPDGPMSGLLVLIIGAIMAFYSVKKIFNSKKE